MTQGQAKMQKGISQKHLHSRISYLYQASTYLTHVANQSQAETPCADDEFKKRYGSGGELHRAATAPKAVSGESLPMSPIEGDHRVPETSSHHISKDFALSRQLLVHLRAVSLRTQIRLTPAVKHTICKRCSLPLVPGSTSTSYIENKSSEGRKPWADVLVTTCTACGTSRRIPMEAKRQVRKESRICKRQVKKKQGHRAV